VSTGYKCTILGLIDEGQITLFLRPTFAIMIPPGDIKMIQQLQNKKTRQSFSGKKKTRSQPSFYDFMGKMKIS